MVLGIHVFPIIYTEVRESINIKFLFSLVILLSIHRMALYIAKCSAETMLSISEILQVIVYNSFICAAVPTLS